MARWRRERGGETSLFPGFVDVSEIGIGSLATVFRAKESSTGRAVALKLLNVRDVSPRALESFHRESIALGALSSHPNIVTLYRTFQTPDGRPVLVLELCVGSVSDRIRGGEGMPADEAVSIAIKVSGALETAHRSQILHRDVKPQNILITEFGEPALADFGVAMLQSASETTAGLFDFTTLHAAPELLEGKQTSAATDVYELASTLYQLVSGQSAFRAYEGESPASVILRILRDPVRPVLAQGVPVQLSDLLIAAMSKDKDHRPETAAEFAAELAQVEQAQGWPQTQFLVRGAGGTATIGSQPSISRLPGPVKHREVIAVPEPIPAIEPVAMVEPEPVFIPPAPEATPAPAVDRFESSFIETRPPHEEPVVADDPVVAEVPVVADEPVVAEVPVAADAPVAAEKPAVAEAAIATEPLIASTVFATAAPTPSVAAPPTPIPFVRMLVVNPGTTEFVDPLAASREEFQAAEAIDVGAPAKPEAPTDAEAAAEPAAAPAEPELETEPEPEPEPDPEPEPEPEPEPLRAAHTAPPAPVLAAASSSWSEPVIVQYPIPPIGIPPIGIPPTQAAGQHRGPDLFDGMDELEVESAHPRPAQPGTYDLTPEPGLTDEPARAHSGLDMVAHPSEQVPEQPNETVSEPAVDATDDEAEATTHPALIPTASTPLAPPAFNQAAPAVRTEAISARPADSTEPVDVKSLPPHLLLKSWSHTAADNPGVFWVGGILWGAVLISLFLYAIASLGGSTSHTGLVLLVVVALALVTSLVCVKARRTLTVDDVGIRTRDGFRSVTLDWSDVRSIQLRPLPDSRTESDRSLLVAHATDDETLLWPTAGATTATNRLLAIVEGYQERYRIGESLAPRKSDRATH
ncbi:serine/threonine protein kinase [Jatrophihabitans sp. GAS493]|uniref:protein kinase domain-containing protein n=1 Tax=Jatrophihabitans sp. GAS493 TaxID=1907575 RepID=UPI000BB97220|nr:protein kinase [Jatrophihabitans sp. GAS493]SOD71871.1 serine/threonine protein kinase [Jatrophihabitans sp. GAS493]